MYFARLKFLTKWKPHREGIGIWNSDWYDRILQNLPLKYNFQEGIAWLVPFVWVVWTISFTVRWASNGFNWVSVLCTTILKDVFWVSKILIKLVSIGTLPKLPQALWNVWKYCPPIILTKTKIIMSCPVLSLKRGSVPNLQDHEINLSRIS